MALSHHEHPINETQQSIQLQRYSHAINHRHDFTPSIGMLYPVKVTEMFPGRSVRYNVQNVTQLMPLVGDCKQDMYMYTETVFSAWHSVWAKWPLFRYGKMNPNSTIQVPQTVPTFTLAKLIQLWQQMYPSNPNSQVLFLAPGSLLDVLYGLCNLLKAVPAGSQPGSAGAQDLLNNLHPDILSRPLNALFLRAFYHHYLINHTNEWLNGVRGDMVNDEYPYRNDDTMTDAELLRILNFTLTARPELSFFNGVAPVIQHERDYFTSANPLPQKGAAITTVSGQTIQDLTKAIHQQEILEKDADAGNSHFNAIVSRYGVTPRSLGVMRPVTAATPTRQVISINPIFNQAGDTVAPSSGGLSGVNFQGDISGRGFSADGNHHVDYQADVDGCVLTCVFIRPETIYHQGLHRMYTRTTRNDFFEPSMITDGDEPIFMHEIYFGLMSQQNTSAVPPEGVFGYRNKYLDYVYAPSRISGELRTTMKHWSLHRDFSSTPNLNDTFVRTFDTPTRIFSYEGQESRKGYPRFICYMQFQGEMNDFIPNYTKREI